MSNTRGRPRLLGGGGKMVSAYLPLTMFYALERYCTDNACSRNEAIRRLLAPRLGES